MRILRNSFISVAACLLLATPADAQDPGVFIDPGDPSAKEYALPFESERRQADPVQGPSARVAPGARTSPTFGAGITSGNAPSSDGSSSGGSSSGGSSSDGSRESEREAPGEARKNASDSEAAVIRAATANPGAPDGGAGVTLTIAGIALTVLLIGGAAGLLWRRRV